MTFSLADLIKARKQIVLLREVSLERDYGLAVGILDKLLTDLDAYQNSQWLILLTRDDPDLARFARGEIASLTRIGDLTEEQAMSRVGQAIVQAMLDNT